MTIDRNDPRLTAYVLNELDQAEKAEVEAALQESEELRREVEEIRQACGRLGESLLQEPDVGLTPEQIEQIEKAVRPQETTRPWWFRPGLPVAASVLLAAILFGPGWVQRLQPAKEVQVSDQQHAAVQEMEEVEGLELDVLGEVELAARNKNEDLADESESYELNRQFAQGREVPDGSSQEPPRSSDERSGWYRANQARADADAEKMERQPVGKVIEGRSSQVADALARSFKKGADLKQPAVAQAEARARDASGPAPAETQVETPAFDFEGRRTGNRETEMAENRPREESFQTDPSSSATTVGGELGRRDLEGAQYARNKRVIGESVENLTLGAPARIPQAQLKAGLKTGEEFSHEPPEEASVRGYHFEDRDRYRYPHPPRRHRPRPRPDFNTESYDRIVENPFVRVEDDPRSTFSIDVDTASYANVRRFLGQGTRPPKDAVRIEELINYFSYDYPQPHGEQPFSISLEVAEAPWRKEHRLVQVGLKGREVGEETRPSSNLVFLIDVSGSMRPSNKLPLLKKSMRMLVDRLTENDTVAMVVYAGASGLVLPSTTGDQKSVILHALDNLHAGGSTNGGAGIELAYKCAVDSFIRGGINRVILATDGDFNVGITHQGDLIRLIEKRRQSGVFLSVLGFGMGNLKDANLEKLADKGNGNYSYIDSEREAHKVLVEQMNSTLVTIAKDVKIQIEFNPDRVQAYRLIGYENRVLAHQDFNDDRKDAGEIGAGHTVTALYEVVPSGVDMNVPGVDPLRYQPSAERARIEADRVEKVPHPNELMFVRLRYKRPDGESSRLIETPLVDRNRRFSDSSRDFKFAAAVASFGMLLRDSSYRGDASFDEVLNWGLAGKGEDSHGYRQGFLRLVIQAQSLELPFLRQHR